MGLTGNIWLAEWSVLESVWNVLAVGSLLNLAALSVTMMRWWSLLGQDAVIDLDDDLSEDMLEDEHTDTAGSSVLLGTDEAMDIDDWEQENAPWSG